MKQESSDKLQYNVMLYRGIRYALVALLILVIVLVLTGNKQSKAAFDTVRSAVSGCIQTDKAELNSERYLKKFFGLNPDDYDGVMIYTPGTSMYANEVVLIKLKDLSQSEAVTSAIEERIASQLNIFEGYAPEQVELLENAVLDVRGNYILYIVDTDAAEVDEVFRSSL